MATPSGTWSCIVIGAGMSGLMAAGRLAEDGVNVLILDKGRGVGGRMATRRRDAAPGTHPARWDHGAQFVTAATPEFGSRVAEWQEAGVVDVWPVPGGHHPRFRGTDGMSGIARHLATGLTISLETRVIAIVPGRRSWTIRTDAGAEHAAEAVILTPPVPQSLALLDAGGVELARAHRDALAAIEYAPCIAVLALLEGESGVPAPGGLELDGEPIAWIADNRRKGISPEATTITIHAGPRFSRAHWDDDAQQVARLLLAEAAAWIGSPVRFAEVHRWRYARPLTIHTGPCLVLRSDPPALIMAGDAFAGARIEGAALSGLAAARPNGRLLSGRARRG